jgi:limonene-1,2-epoxide hydrolase
MSQDLSEYNKTIALKWFDAFNRQHLNDLLSLYDEQAQHYSPKLKIRNPDTNGLISGKESLTLWWKDAFERLPELHYKLIKLTADETQVFMEYIRQNPGEVDLPVAEVLEIKNGLIVYSRVYHG